MFTGLITDQAEVRQISDQGDRRFRLGVRQNRERLELSHMSMGASIACSGACMTVVDFGSGWFDFEASRESLARTTLHDWQIGTLVNLEGSLGLGDPLGGHLVSGHVDGLARICEIESIGDSNRVRFEVPNSLAPFIAEKGSVALDGVSLTVNAVNGSCFDVNIIAHTWQVTSFGQCKEGMAMNLEIDMLARYVSRQLAFRV